MTHGWPEIPYEPWRETCEALHLYAQIIGKYRLAHTPWVNHSWHATLYVTPRGLSTSGVPDRPGMIEVRLDLIAHRVVVEASDGRMVAFPLQKGTVAEFYARMRDSIALVGGDPHFHGVPNEVPERIPFAEDRAIRPYDAEAVSRFHQALLSVHRVFSTFRTSYLGKTSPVHLFWGSFDLAVTRFSGRSAPLHPGGIPGLPDEVTREAYSHEVSSAGFWPGGAGLDFPAFYSYAYPQPHGFNSARVTPASASFDPKLGEFLLPYDVVRQAPDPEEELSAFLRSTYDAAADLGGWDRAKLDCSTGAPRVVRRIP